jgi:hypothetical protein
MPQKIITSCGMESSGGLPPCLPMTDYVWGLTVGLYAIGGLVGSLGTVFTIIGGIFSALAVNTGMVSNNNISGTIILITRIGPI